MGKKKTLKDGITQDEELLIKSKMLGKPNEKSKDNEINCNKALNYKINIKCKNDKQKNFLNNLKKSENEICFGLGSAGTGKSFLSMAMALQLLKADDNDFHKIVIFVPTCESVKELSLGFLKGDLNEKTEVYKQCTINTIEKILQFSNNPNFKEITAALIKCNIIQFEFINFVKGKTFSNCICLLEEAEDLSREDMLLLITRKGGDSCKLFITGDDKQISRSDLRKNKQQSGLKFASQILEDMKEISVDIFNEEDIVRDKLLTEIIKRWEKNINL